MESSSDTEPLSKKRKVKKSKSESSQDLKFEDDLDSDKE